MDKADIVKLKTRLSCVMRIVCLAVLLAIILVIVFVALLNEHVKNLNDETTVNQKSSDEENVENLEKILQRQESFSDYEF
ncbi:hypothetical protein HUJ04_007060 [Dendroctonus ponderosae]|nr:hypothetical protein HUJ04_007060 [Dendroctonus ponderosae]